MTATTASRASARLVAAGRVLDEPTVIEPGAWPRAATWLIRLALEHALDEHWAATRPEIARADRRAQLLVLTRLGDADLGLRATELWHVLSRAAHHHAYELAPTAAELRSWHQDVTLLVADLRAAS